MLSVIDRKNSNETKLRAKGFPIQAKNFHRKKFDFDLNENSEKLWFYCAGIFLLTIMEQLHLKN